MNRRLPALDGIRALAIALVLVAHGGLGRVVPGGLGVTAFFALSGFLITAQLLGEHAVHGRVALGRFYARRALRLLPAQWCFVLAAGLAFIAFGGHVSALAWAAAAGQFANDAEVFTRAFDSTDGLPHPFVTLWSLALEEQFYLLWPPVLAFALLRRVSLPRIAVALLTICVAVLAWRLVLAGACAGAHGAGGWCGAHPPDRMGKGTDTRFDALAYGALAAVLLAGPCADRCRALLRRGPLVTAFLALLAATLAMRDPFYRDTLRWSLQGLAFAVLIPAAVERAPRALDHPALVAIGRLSYGLYLWHWLALTGADAIVPARSGPRWLAIYAGGTAALTLASWFAIERPLLARRHRLGSGAPAALTPTASRSAPSAPAGTAAVEDAALA